MSCRALIVATLLSTATQPLAAQVLFEAPVQDKLIDNGSLAGSAVVATAGDVDGDGDLDLVHGRAFGGGHYVDVLVNDGSGDLELAAHLATPAFVGRTQLADLDGDGDLDLVAAGPSARVFPGAGDGSFGPASVVYTSPTGNVSRVDVLELTGDGLPDLLISAGSINPGDTGRVELLAGLGDGSFAPAQLIDLMGSGYVPTRAFAADLDDDGLDDLVVVAGNVMSSAARVYRALAGGGFAPPVAYPFSASFGDALLLADATGDGRPDLVLASPLGLGFKPGAGDGSFGPAQLLATGPFSDPLVADFDADGLVDLAGFDRTSRELVFWLGDGSGGYVEDLRQTPAADNHTSELGCADLDQDGRPDLFRMGSHETTYHLTRWRNHSYGPGAPFVELGRGLSGAHVSGQAWPAEPILVADGTLHAGDDLTVTLARHATTPQKAWLVLGFAALNAPFKGGTLVPLPDVLIGPLAFPDSDDLVSLTAPMPAAVPAGLSFWMQGWFGPGPAIEDVYATNAVRATTP